MNTKITHTALISAFVIVAAFLFPVRAMAAKVIWDEQVRVGDLVAFPSVRDSNTYYYAATKARIARENGLPKFSFVRFSEENIAGGERALGGGVVHALVELGVSEAEIERAREALSEVVPGARLVGPVAYNSGTFALITSQAGTEGEEGAAQIIGMGKAPLLEGNRAAISMLLTARSANILWATFNTPTPDISFSFNMDVEAYRSPIEATISADWSKIYEHENFSAAFRAGVDSESAQIMLGAEIENTLDELGNSGAIEIEYIGEDESMERVTEAAYNDIREIMFSPANMAGSNNFTPNYQDSAYDRASSAFEDAERNRKARNDRAVADRDAARAASASAAGSEAGLESNTANIEQLEREAIDARRIADQAEQQYQELVQQVAAADSATPPPAIAAARERRDAKVATADRIEQQLRERRNAQTTESEEAASNRALANATEGDLDWEQGTQLTVSAYVAYRMKTVKQTGTFRQSMRKFKAQTFALRFDENIGDFRRYLDDERVFVETELDRMVFSQREIFVETSELDAVYFDNALNSVVVSIRKTHENGGVTRDDVRITGDSFEDTNIAMRYVSDGDRDAEAFGHYEYKVDWNYRGNMRFEGDWLPSDSPSVPLSPPLTMQDVQVNLDPEFVDRLGILGATIRVSSPIGERAIRGPVISLRPSLDNDDGYSASVPVLAANDAPFVNYDIDLTLETGRELPLVDRQSSSTLIVVNDQWGE